MAEQIDAYYTLAATTKMLPLLHAAYDYFQIVKNNPFTVSRTKPVPDSTELEEFVKVLMRFRAVVAGWTNPILQYASSPNVPSRVAAFAPQPRSWPEHFEAVARYAKGRFYIDQLLVAVSILEGALGIMLDDVGEKYEELTLGQKWGEVIKQIKKGNWSISQQLQTDIGEIVDRRNMVIHHSGKYVSQRYDLNMAAPLAIPLERNRGPQKRVILS
ncbi:MAG: hypothetical protein HY681_13850 [Chloroflexi bacterium]|nr:hypothetical protein [Chloroflexota bacterium]